MGLKIKAVFCFVALFSVGLGSELRCTSDVEADILFIIDSSYSIVSRDFHLMLTFVANLTDYFMLGPGHIQFSALTFSSKVTHLFDFGTYTDHTALRDAILRTNKTAGGSLTKLALEYARKYSFTPSHGARPGVPKIAIVLTDGESSSLTQTSEEAAFLKALGVHTIAIGIGPYNIQELLSIAWSEDNVFTSHDFYFLNSLQGAVNNKTCSEVIRAQCKELADIILILDSSTTFPEPLFLSQLDFAGKLTRQFDIGVNDVRFAAVLISTQPIKLFDLKTYAGHVTLLNALNATQYQAGDQNTSAAIQVIMTQHMFSPANGGRQNATKILIIMTDGHSTDPLAVVQSADELKRDGIHIMSIGVGDNLDLDQLRALASSDDNVFQAPSRDVLELIQEQVANRTCQLHFDEQYDLSEICEKNNWSTSNHSHPTNCSMYIECRLYVTHEQSCPAGQAFLAPHCQPLEHVPSCHAATTTTPTTTSPTTSKTPHTTTPRPDLSIANICFENHWANGLHPHPSDCTLFIQCLDYTTYIIDCPTGLVFDPTKIQCTDPAEAEPCNDNWTKQPTTTTAASNLIISADDTTLCRDNNWATGTHPHPTLCDRYVICNAFNTIIVQCTDGNVYDPVRLVCVHPSIAAPCNDAKTTVASFVTGASACTTTARGDILFIMDSSSSIGISNHTRQLQFVSDLTTNFPLGPNNIQFSAIIFASDAHSVFPFNAYYDHNSLRSAIMNIGYLGSNTNTFTALELARTTSFTGASGSRNDVPHVAIVITDGLSSDMNRTIQEARILKNLNVKILSIGIADAHREELVGIASTVQDVFQADSYVVLPTLQHEVSSQTCNQVINTHCSNMSVADIILVMDSSSSIGYSNYQIQLRFAANLTQNFKIGPNDVRIAAISFGTDAHTLFKLDTYNDHNSIYQAIISSTYLSSSTNTAHALKQILTQNLFEPSSGGRPSATKIVIVLTDGESNDPADTKAQAGHLKDRGIHMISIGIGGAVNSQELVALSSNPQNIFVSPGFDVLHRLEEEVTNRTCGIPGEVALSDLWNVCREQNWVNGIHAHPFDCTKFIECTFLHTAIMSCPSSLVYDPILQTCTHKSEATPCTDHNDYIPYPGQSTPVPPTTVPAIAIDVSSTCRDNHWQNGIFPHPYDCSFYLTCTNYQTVVTPCPQGLVYDPIIRSCMNPEHANPCNDVKTTPSHVITTQKFATTTSPKYDLTDICREYNLPDGIYPDPGSCTHFVECVDKITYHMECPEGLEFNTHTLLCDDVHLIDCNENYRFQFETVHTG